jgi:DnaJ-class molecular chaperone
MSQGKDFYNVLGVSRDASQESISAAFKKLAMEHHPVRLARRASKSRSPRFNSFL